MVPQWTIEKKRDGLCLTEQEIFEFVQGFTTGAIPDYQMAALAMAVTCQGMDVQETAALTDAMLRSGSRLNTSSLSAYKVDKHSTGGIGDKVSLALAPLAASCGLAVPMLSGRGLGLTGGTLDKLESIPGYRTDLSKEAMVNVVDQCGCSINGQTSDLVPADKKLYALRDVTGTVPSIPLITASIMSKKLAEGLEGLVLDVKCGSGAFMKDLNNAEPLAKSLLKVGQRMGLDMVAVLTDMNEPLGQTIGNNLEVMEAIALLKGEGPPDLREVTMELGVHMLLLSRKANSRTEAKELLQAKLQKGAAFDRFKNMVAAHGGEEKVLDNPALFPKAAFQVPYNAPRDGVLTQVHAGAVGKACLVLGAGRKAVDDLIDSTVGLSHCAKRGTQVQKGDTLAYIHANSQDALEHAKLLLEEAFVFGEENRASQSKIIKVMDATPDTT